LARRQGTQDTGPHLLPAVAAALTRAQKPREHTAVHASELAVKPDSQIFGDIVDYCCYGWNTLIDQPWKIISIAAVSHSEDWH
jgi:hypothetical protein